MGRFTTSNAAVDAVATAVTIAVTTVTIAAAAVATVTTTTAGTYLSNPLTLLLSDHVFSPNTSTPQPQQSSQSSFKWVFAHTHLSDHFVVFTSEVDGCLQSYF